MGSVLEITLADSEPRRDCDALEAAFAEASRIECLLSAFRPESELSRLNRDAPRGPVKADPELLWLIGEARRYSRASDGAVDVTVAPLMRLWRFRDDRNGGMPLAPPSPEEIRSLLACVGSEHVTVDSDTGTVAYDAPGVELEFGGMGKGYAVDAVVRVLRAHGISSALVAFGSTTYAIGRPPGQRAWRIGIRHPRDDARVLAAVRLVDRAIATSGDYEQWIRIAGLRYGHILDPRSGRPAAGASSASVVAPTALEADAFSTAAFVLGPQQGAALLGRQGFEGMMVSDDRGRLATIPTEGWKALAARRIRGAVSRRQFVIGALAALAWLIVRPPLGEAVVYLSREEALKGLMPAAEQVREETVTLTDAQRERLYALLGSRIRDRAVTFWIGLQGDRPASYATVLDVIGKEQPITFMVAVSPEGAVQAVEVLAYRESQGSEIRSKRFMRQFTGKTLAAPLKLGRDIDSISGASLSSRSTAYAVKKALALVDVVYRGEGQPTP
jgi:thiamine biosynthesis lipoprotein